jgi:hypothetical protein
MDLLGMHFSPPGRPAVSSDDAGQVVDPDDDEDRHGFQTGNGKNVLVRLAADPPDVMITGFRRQELIWRKLLKMPNVACKVAVCAGSC